MRKILNLCWENYNGLSSVIRMITYKVTIDGESAIGQVGVLDPDPENFIALDQLTEATVMSWVSEDLWVALEDKLLNPPPAKMEGAGLPWQNESI